MIEIGRLVVKTAGRDAAKKGVIVDILDKNYVLIDGQVRRRKCNIAHIEPLDQVIKIKKGASHDIVVEEFKKLGIETKEKKSKPKTERAKRIRGKKKVAEEKPKEKKSLLKRKKTDKAAKEEGIEKAIAEEKPKKETK